MVRLRSRLGIDDLPDRMQRAIGVVLLIGLAVRLTLAFTTYGVQYDVDSEHIMANALVHHPLHAYDTDRWPYPGGFLPFLGGSLGLAHLTGITFHTLVKLPASIADLALALLVQSVLAHRGASPGRRVAATALVALGPSFAIISGFHGQIDAFAILPAVAAVAVWDRDGRHRALTSGLLIGIGAAIKTVPVFTLVVLLPHVRSRREAARLIGPALAVPLLSLVPFLVADRTHTIAALRANRGVPGFGGLSLLTQPALARLWLQHDTLTVGHLSGELTRFQQLMVLAAVAAVATLLWRCRTGVWAGSALLWLSVSAANPNFSFQYVVWVLPWLLTADLLGLATALQAVLLPPIVMLYWRVGHGLRDDVLYVPLMALAWWLTAAGALALAVRIGRAGGLSIDPLRRRLVGRQWLGFVRRWNVRGAAAACGVVLVGASLAGAATSTVGPPTPAGPAPGGAGPSAVASDSTHGPGGSTRPSPFTSAGTSRPLAGGSARTSSAAGPSASAPVGASAAPTPTPVRSLLPPSPSRP